MNFKINLRPYPAAPYFTAEGHARSFDPSRHHADEDMSDSESLIRAFFELPSEFVMSIHKHSEKDNVSGNFNTLIVRDDPETGKRNTPENVDENFKPNMVDLSFSFPYATVDLKSCSAVMIDPNFSLGVPTNFFLLFSGSGFGRFENFITSPGFEKEAFVLRSVLEDIAAKGMEQLLRESNYKAAVLYQLIESCAFFEPAVQKEYRSKTIITAFVESKILEEINKMGYETGVDFQGEQTLISVANYATQSKESLEMFSDRISAL